MRVFNFSGDFSTTYIGYKKLVEFYNYAKKVPKGEPLSLNFYNMGFIEANMSALLSSMFHKLNHERQMKFTTDWEFVESKFDVLLRNGCLVKQGDKKKDDYRNSTVQLKQFLGNEDAAFIKYIEKDLFKHRGLNKLSFVFKETIREQLIEVFSNYEIHAQTLYPLFVCGQYYPNRGELLFTIVDLGVGFLPAIKKFNDGRITSDADAIKWAIKDCNTTKANEPGGNGLFKIQECLKGEHGHVDIISGNAFWTTKPRFGTRVDNYNILDTKYVGSTINLCFNCK